MLYTQKNIQHVKAFSSEVILQLMVDGNSTTKAGWDVLPKSSPSITSYIVLPMGIAIRFLPELWT